jgi:predicted nucleic acid-binding protein
MSSTTVRTFVDTNVWVYANDASDPTKRGRAREVLETDADGIWTSAQVMGELYVTLTRKLVARMSPAAAGAVMHGLARLRVAPLGAAEVQDAIAISDRHQMSYWDALLLATARSVGCERLLTEDLASGAVIAGVRVENPFGASPRRLADPVAPYAAQSWDDASLRTALEAYASAARDAGMKPNAVHSYWDYARRFLDWREGLYPRGATSRPVPERSVGAADLFEDADEYERSLAAGLSEAAIDAYARHARFFTRWLAGDFQPGSRLAGRR